jgi:hypothetical protein
MHIPPDTSATLTYLLGKYGAALTFEQTAAELKYPSLAAAKSARQRGTFPVPIRRAGDRHLCSAVDLTAFLAGVPASNLSLPEPKRGRGRPRKQA